MKYRIENCFNKAALTYDKYVQQLAQRKADRKATK